MKHSINIHEYEFKIKSKPNYHDNLIFSIYEKKTETRIVEGVKTDFVLWERHSEYHDSYLKTLEYLKELIIERQNQEVCYLERIIESIQGKKENNGGELD